MEFSHTPVLLGEVVDVLAPTRGGVFVDGTLGGGGHAEAILSLLPAGSLYVGIDRDPEALQAASERLAGFGDMFLPLHGNFFDMKALLGARGIGKADGILLDLGVSSHQLDTPERGFSYRSDAPLDMRMDRTCGQTAADVVNGYPEGELARIFREYGEERFSGRIAGAIVRERGKRPIETTAELADVVRSAIPAKFRGEAQHPARRVFQAIRIEVNRELDGLRGAVDDALDLLQKDGVLCIITFHSLEDRIVKQAFRSYEHPCTCPPSAPICVCGKKPTAAVLTRKPVTAGEEELENNSRASCAKMRAVRKI